MTDHASAAYTKKTTVNFQHLFPRYGKMQKVTKDHQKCHGFIKNIWFPITITTATFNFYEDRQISTPHNINTPEPIDKKISRIDYTGEGTSYTKFGRHPFSGGFWANGWNIIKIIFIYLFIPFFFDQPTGHLGRIFTCNSSKDVKSRKDMPYWGYKT